MKNKADYYGDVLTVSEMCCFMNICRNTAIKLLNNGTIKAAKVGRDWRIYKQNIIDYLNGVS